MVILTLNCGSSSAKYQVYDWDNKDVLATGVVERVTAPGSVITHKPKGKDKFVKESPCPTHKEAIELILDAITDKDHGVISDMSVIGAVGHRVLHGGDKFTKSVKVTPEVLDTFRSVIGLGPLHMPANIMGIEAAQKVLPNVPHVAVMDTAWHQTMPPASYRYAVPKEWYEKYAARRYGFHGTSFLYTANRASVLLHKAPKDTNVIIAHVGNGASMCAVKNGCCFDTSMGITPIEGLVMGTRTGDVDVTLPFYIMRQTGMSVEEMDNALNKKSGLLGLSDGLSSDFRDLNEAAESGNEAAKNALEVLCYGIAKFVGGYVAAMNGVDAIIFTAGIGENAIPVREKVVSYLGYLGITLDKEANGYRGEEKVISTPDSKVKVAVIPTNEEIVIARDTLHLVTGK